MHRHRAISVFCLAICLAAARFAGAANAAPNVAPSVAPNTVPCRTGGPYDKWLAEFEREAMAQGVSQQTIAAAAPYLTYDQRIVNIGRGQRVFTQTFLEFSDRMAAAAYRIQRGAALIKTYTPVFAKIDQQFGVPAPVIVAFWALESDFGANMGNYHTPSAIASLAYDCRRADRFRGQLLDALRLIQRGDLRPADMIGSWAGELGQTQMMPSEYYQYAVDYDGNGTRNLLRSAPDVLASTANYLVGLGWRRGEPWLTEVRVPPTMPWQQADLDTKLPRSKWAAYGVTLADGRPLPADDLPASLLLPVGRFGPAFLAYDNFRVYLQWNNALVYSTTAAYLGTRIAGAPPLHRGNPPPPLAFSDVKALQAMLAHAGYDVGAIDGFLGLKTRQAVKAMQIKYNLPADSYPTAELLARMRGAH